MGATVAQSRRDRRSRDERETHGPSGMRRATQGKISEIKREQRGGMRQSVPSDCAVTGLQAPRQPDFCIWRAAECR